MENIQLHGLGVFMVWSRSLFHSVLSVQKKTCAHSPGSLFLPTGDNHCLASRFHGSAQPWYFIYIEIAQHVAFVPHFPQWTQFEGLFTLWPVGVYHSFFMASASSLCMQVTCLSSHSLMDICFILYPLSAAKTSDYRILWRVASKSNVRIIWFSAFKDFGLASG